MSTGSSRLPESVRPYFESAPLAALFLGVSSGFAFAMLGATLTTRLAQHGVTKGAGGAPPPPPLPPPPPPPLAPPPARRHQGRGARLRAPLSRLHPQVPGGPHRRPRPPAADRTFRPAP